MTFAAVPACAICVPARDERRRLPALLDALSRQKGGAIATLCILFDGCEDGSDELVRQFRAALPFPVVTRRLPRRVRPNAGRARRAAMELGAALVGRHGLLLSTDADTIPDPDWLSRSVAALAEVDVVAGRIRRLSAERLPLRCRYEAYLDRLHRLRRTIDLIDYDPAPSHPSLGGASLGIRAAVYEALDGFRPLPLGEDVDLVERARLSGYRVRHDRQVGVATSARTHGRAPDGLAAELRALEHGRALPPVPHPFHAARHYERQAHARRAFAQLGRCRLTLTALSAATGQTPDALLRRHHNVRTPDAFVTTLWRGHRLKLVLPLEHAEPMLAELERRHREQVA